MQISLGLQTFGNERGLKGDRRKNLRVRVKGDDRAAAAHLANFLQSRGGLAAGEPLLPLDAATLDSGDQAVGEGGDHRGADSVQPTRV